MEKREQQNQRYAMHIIICVVIMIVSFIFVLFLVRTESHYRQMQQIDEFTKQTNSSTAAHIEGIFSSKRKDIVALVSVYADGEEPLTVDSDLLKKWKKARCLMLFALLIRTESVLPVVGKLQMSVTASIICGECREKPGCPES